MVKIAICAVAFATLCVALARDSHRAQENSGSNIGKPVKVDRSNLKAHDPYDVIQAEDYDYSYNTEVVSADDPDDNSTAPLEMAFIKGTSVLGYYDINFGLGANRIELRVGQLYNTDGPRRGGVINIHLGSPQATPLVTVLIDYGMVYHYLTLSQFLDPLPSGLQDVYFTFEVDMAGYNLCNLNWFKFYSAYD